MCAYVYIYIYIYIYNVIELSLSGAPKVAFLDAAHAAGITFKTRRRLPGDRRAGWEQALLPSPIDASEAKPAIRSQTPLEVVAQEAKISIMIARFQASPGGSWSLRGPPPRGTTPAPACAY